MKKQLLALAMAAVFTTPAFAAENTGVVVNGVRQARQDIGNICEENPFPCFRYVLWRRNAALRQKAAVRPSPL